MSLRENLKKETHVLHSQLDSSLPMMAEHFDLNLYIKILKKFYGFYLPFEKQILASSALKDLNFNYEERLKNPKLKEDLTLLGESLEGISFFTPLPFLSSPARVLGALYVIEGSTLGGQFIQKRLKQKLGETTPLNFFSGYGDKNSEYWKNFLILLESFEEKKEKHPEVIDAALETFRSVSLALKD